MKKIMGMLRIPLTIIFLIAWVVAAISFAGDGPRNRRGGGGNYSVAEPAAIMLLGAGLISLGIYAKRKRGKKQ